MVTGVGDVHEAIGRERHVIRPVEARGRGSRWTLVASIGGLVLTGDRAGGATGERIDDAVEAFAADAPDALVLPVGDVEHLVWPDGQVSATDVGQEPDVTIAARTCTAGNAHDTLDDPVRADEAHD